MFIDPLLLAPVGLVNMLMDQLALRLIELLSIDLWKSVKVVLNGHTDCCASALCLSPF